MAERAGRPGTCDDRGSESQSVSAGPPSPPDHSYRTTAQCDHTVTTVTISLGESQSPSTTPHHTTDYNHLQTQTESGDVK